MAQRIRRPSGGLGDWRTHYELIWKPTNMATTPHDGMTLPEFTAARQVLASALEKFDQAAPTCQRCKHFEMGDCKLHGATVPKEFQTTPGQCGDWVFDGIPF